jgi:hypothetical protein
MKNLIYRLLTKLIIKINKKELLSINNSEKKFTKIYKTNYWGNNESVSGSGSTIEYTKGLRVELEKLLINFKVKSIFDAPCGDFNWMRLIVADKNITYIGGDIVKPLVERNIELYNSINIKFINIDLTKNQYPYADIMICRDCLFHLSYKDINLVLKNFIDSQIPYLLTTSHIDVIKNADIITGDYREIDLFSPPFNFPNEVLCRIKDWIEPLPPREMCLWTRDQIISTLKDNKLSNYD